MKAVRRSVSIRDATYQRLQNFCAKHNKSNSGYIEEILAEHLDDAKEPTPVKVERHEPIETPQVDIDKLISTYFSFKG